MNTQEEQAPLPPDWAERDFAESWWLAHRIIGDDVKSGRRDMPAIFVPRRAREGSDRVAQGEGQ